MLEKKEVFRLARLAGLSLDEKEAEQLFRELGRMLEYVGQLNEVETQGIEPEVVSGAGESRLRPDRVGESLPVEDALSGAPERDGAFFRVPAVITARRDAKNSRP